MGKSVCEGCSFAKWARHKTLGEYGYGECGYNLVAPPSFRIERLPIFKGDKGVQECTLREKA